MIGFAHSTIFWITVANLLYFVSYSVHDILWLRVLSVVAALLLVPYYAMQPVPLVAAIGWNVLFIAINAYWIVRLVHERRPVHFTPDEARLKELSFPSLTPREARALFALGVWVDAGPGTSLVQADNVHERFSLILRGVADVVHRGAKIGELGEGQFLGPVDGSAAVLDLDVVARSPSRLMCWSRKYLDGFLANRPDVALTLDRSVGYELEKLLDTALSKLNGT
jgi:hypothetical protein